MNLKDLSAILGTWVAIVSAIAGGVFTYNEYKRQGDEAERQNQQRMDERTLQTFKMYEEFRNSTMLERRAEFHKMPSDDPGLDFWINYFDTVQACLESNLCDKTLVDQLFKPYAVASLDEVQCRIMKVRELEKSYNLPREQGYGLLTISGVGEPSCVPDPEPPAPAKPAAKPKAAASAPAPTPAAEAPPAPSGRGGRGSSASAPPSEASPEPATPARGRGN